uniref:protein-tyrosine-phosphatase n=1 Tax=Myotis lucifugus TaxID=59463 RepID=G1QD21_MYOLU
DHSRVKLQNAENDYINASLVDTEETQRTYILTLGPLPNTGCHCWLMVWQQETESGCHAKPSCAERKKLFKETGFNVTFLSEDVKSQYTVHLLQLANISKGEARTISRAHYAIWRFWIPESPVSFLCFLFKVRESGCNPEHGPAVIHCSAGIQSDTLSLAETCLVLMGKGDDIALPNLKQLLLNMRKYQMGLFQSPNQLRFSYITVTERAMFTKGIQIYRNGGKNFLKKYSGIRIGLEEKTLTGNSPKMQETMENSESALWKQIQEDRKTNTAQKVRQMKQRPTETKRKTWFIEMRLNEK